MLRSLVGSEMCIRDRYQRRVRASPADAYNMPEETHLTCPLVFITSEVDKRVPKKTTMRAIEEVRRRYPTVPVEHLELRHSTHSSMAVQDVEDRDLSLIHI
eukprot:TRINITY_DN6649_c0_g1_i2.p1 TRINITY_DN6649_c0_g1~~TRINITY_DN6649_c0_g1_i2.p1  ORF type:complete len:101 (+),score=36.69 TRINITY_DN6649_c0_g1_i2:153-455(+)